MSIRPHVVKKYVVEYGWIPNLEEFDTMLEKMREIDENIIEWKDESGNSYELSKEILRQIRYDHSIDDEVREFADKLLQSSDPNLEYVRIDLF